MIDISINDSQIKSIIDSRRGFLGIRTEFILDTVIENSNADKAGMLKGDKLIAVNDSSMMFFDQYVDFFRANRNSTQSVSVQRGSATYTFDVDVDSLGMIGVATLPFAGIETEHQDYTFFESVPAGLLLGAEQVKDYLRQFRLIFNPETEAFKSLGSFGAIGSMFPERWDWHSFWLLTAFISIILAVVNLLPIPALDGGHVMFVLFEMVSGKKPGDKFMEYAQIVGFVIILAIFILAIRNDIVNFLM
jgi:regulator of sigma E protease